MKNDNPILNNPYEEPEYHYFTNLDGELNYEKIEEGRRPFDPTVYASPQRERDQTTAFAISDFRETYSSHLINLLRTEVKKWREEKYPGVTGISKDLLEYWFLNDERIFTKKLFFAQREAVETAVWLNETAGKSNVGNSITTQLSDARKTMSDDPAEQLPRISFKMATGTGKTVVMACLILYHFLNRYHYRNDKRFADLFLVVTPGITIKNRLGVLRIDIEGKNDYYHIRDLIPRKYASIVGGINDKLVITNYHSFEYRHLKGNKVSPMDGKIDADGKKTYGTEDAAGMIKRVLGKIRKTNRLLILNDEAHHCYNPKSNKKTEDNEDDENKKAAVWFRGLSDIASKFNIINVYDLSATPYYLKGSGYAPYTLFPWVVTDFGLVEAIESGLVKIPYLPESDDTQSIEESMLKNIYDHVKDELDKKGVRKKKSDAKKEGEQLSEYPPNVPALVKNALDHFYSNYMKFQNLIRQKDERRADIFSTPPVMIIVCNNTSVSKDVYKYIAGYEIQSEDGNKKYFKGNIEEFSNYIDSGMMIKPKKRPPTLLIDSNALEDADQINKEFKEVFAGEIEEFRKDYSILQGQGSALNISDSEILREVVNTVGKQGKLGAHIKCVVSVSMLTEGWDANTVTHVMGVRAFGSQLLCEQVAGRALRRMSYELMGYDKNGKPTEDKRKIVRWKFPPEYARIIGVPFNLFKGGKNPPPNPRDYKTVKALLEREKDYEITFPNLIGYRIDYPDENIHFDYSGVPEFSIDTTTQPTEVSMKHAFGDDEDIMTLKQVMQKREQEIIYRLTRALIKYKFSDDDKNAKFQLFGDLKRAVEHWYHYHLKVINRSDEYKKLILFENEKSVCDNIAHGINPEKNNEQYLMPVFDMYNFGSTKYVHGQTTRDVYSTKKSHVNFVVEDSQWEAVAAKTLDEIDSVISYVKNHFLDFRIPYTKDNKERNYLPDFIAKVKAGNGDIHNLIIEITGFNTDKEEKKYYVEKYWLPAVNAVREKYGYGKWHFIEIAGEAEKKNIRNILTKKIESL